MAVIRKLDGKEVIESLYIRVLENARKMGLSENIEIHIGAKIAKALGLNKSMIINAIEVPVIADEGIIESELETGGFESSIYIFDPDWQIDD